MRTLPPKRLESIAPSTYRVLAIFLLLTPLLVVTHGCGEATDATSSEDAQAESDVVLADIAKEWLVADVMTSAKLDAVLVELRKGDNGETAEALAPFAKRLAAIEQVRPGEAIPQASIDVLKEAVESLSCPDAPTGSIMAVQGLKELLAEDPPAAITIATARVAVAETAYNVLRPALDKEANPADVIDAIKKTLDHGVWTPPPLEEVLQSNTWIDRPVIDSRENLRAHLAKSPPLVSVEEALAMENNTPEDNEKILSALGRLPENDDEVDYEATVTRHAQGDVKTLNAILSSSTTEFEVLDLCTFGLFGFDWDMEPYANADSVVSWRTSEDMLYDVIVMRDDLVWSDGEPLTAHDVQFSYEAIMTSDVPVPAQRSGTDKLRWVKAYDDHTLVYFHRWPLASNVWNVNFQVIPKHIFGESILEDPTLSRAENHVEQNDNPVVGGPYEVTGRIIGSEITLQRRENYYIYKGRQVRDKPYVKTIRFKVLPEPSVALMQLRAGDLDEMMLTPAQWRSRPQTGDQAFYARNTKVHGVEWVYYYFAWNTGTVFFKDKRVRQAMSYAMDYKELLDVLRYGLDSQSVGSFHPDAKWFPDDPAEPYKQDYAKARELLAEAGWTDSNGDGYLDKEIDGRLVTFDFTILCYKPPERLLVCELLKESLQPLGIRCNIRPIDFTTLMQLNREHRFQAFFGGWGTGADPDTMTNIWVTGENRNYIEYSNPEIDALFKQGRRELDPEKRIEIYGRIHNALYEDQPYTWLYVRNSYYAFNKDLRGYMFSPRGPYSYSPGFFSVWKAKSDAAAADASN